MLHNTYPNKLANNIFIHVFLYSHHLSRAMALSDRQFLRWHPVIPCLLVSFLCSNPLPLSVGWTEWQKGWNVTSEIRLQKIMTSVLSVLSHFLADHSAGNQLPCYELSWGKPARWRTEGSSNNLEEYIVTYYINMLPEYLGCLRGAVG